MDPAILLRAATAWIVAARWPKTASRGADQIVVRSWVQVLDDDGRDAGETKLVLEVRRNAAGIAIRGEIAWCTRASSPIFARPNRCNSSRVAAEPPLEPGQSSAHCARRIP